MILRKRTIGRKELLGKMVLRKRTSGKNCEKMYWEKSYPSYTTYIIIIFCYTYCK